MKTYVPLGVVVYEIMIVKAHAQSGNVGIGTFPPNTKPGVNRAFSSHESFTARIWKTLRLFLAPCLSK